MRVQYSHGGARAAVPPQHQGPSLVGRLVTGFGYVALDPRRHGMALLGSLKYAIKAQAFCISNSLTDELRQFGLKTVKVPTLRRGSQQDGEVRQTRHPMLGDHHPWMVVTMIQLSKVLEVGVLMLSP